VPRATQGASPRVERKKALRFPLSPPRERKARAFAGKNFVPELSLWRCVGSIVERFFFSSHHRICNVNSVWPPPLWPDRSRGRWNHLPSGETVSAIFGRVRVAY
jgi:hypothetical protein